MMNWAARARERERELTWKQVQKLCCLSIVYLILSVIFAVSGKKTEWAAAHYRVSIAGDAAQVSRWLLHYVSSFDAASNEAKAGASKTNTAFRGSNSKQQRGEGEVEMEEEEEQEEGVNG